MARQHLVDDLGHPQPRALLEALGQADDRDPRPEQRRGGLERGPEAVRRDADHEHVGVIDRLLERVGAPQRRVQGRDRPGTGVLRAAR